MHIASGKWPIQARIQILEEDHIQFSVQTCIHGGHCPSFVFQRPCPHTYTHICMDAMHACFLYKQQQQQQELRYNKFPKKKDG